MLILCEQTKGLVLERGGKQAKLEEFWPRLLNGSKRCEDGNLLMEFMRMFLLQTNWNFKVRSDSGEEFEYFGYGEEGLDIFQDRWDRVRFDLHATLTKSIDSPLERKQKECWLFSLKEGKLEDVLPEVCKLEESSLTAFTYHQHWLRE
jgi:hypothetical protein